MVKTRIVVEFLCFPFYPFLFSSFFYGRARLPGLSEIRFHRTTPYVQTASTIYLAFLVLAVASPPITLRFRCLPLSVVALHRLTWKSHLKIETFLNISYLRKKTENPASVFLHSMSFLTKRRTHPEGQRNSGTDSREEKRNKIFTKTAMTCCSMLAVTSSGSAGG